MTNNVCSIKPRITNESPAWSFPCSTSQAAQQHSTLEEEQGGGAKSKVPVPATYAYASFPDRASDTTCIEYSPLQGGVQFLAGLARSTFPHACRCLTLRSLYPLPAAGRLSLSSTTTLTRRDSRENTLSHPPATHIPRHAPSTRIVIPRHPFDPSIDPTHRAVIQPTRAKLTAPNQAGRHAISTIPITANRCQICPGAPI